MNWILLFVLGFASAFVGVLAARFFSAQKTVGVLLVDRSDPDELPILFLSIARDKVGKLKHGAIVSLEVKEDSLTEFAKNAESVTET
mgnify:CR=1 FL=1